MAISREEITRIGKEAAHKILEGQSRCVSAGIQLREAHESFRRATPLIFRDNVRGLVSDEDLNVPHSELAIHTGAAGKKLIAFSLTGTQAGLATYDAGEGGCGFIFGREEELFRPPLLKTVNQMWEKRGPNHGGSNPGAKEPWQMTREEYVKSAREWRAEYMPRLTGRALEDELEHVAAVHKGVVLNALGAGKPIPPEVLVDYPDLPKGSNPRGKPTRDDVRVEVWEERDRLHIGIQDKETGDYYVSWWDDEARQMFEDGFFKKAPHLEESVLEYAEDVGILAK